MNSPLSFSIDGSDQITNLPGIAPGAKTSVLTLFMMQESNPGIFFSAFCNGHAFDTMINGPFLILYLLPRIFPFPALLYFFIVLWSSFCRCNFSNRAITSFVFSMFSNLSSIIKGR